MQIVNTTIVTTYTKILKSILSCKNLEQLKNCENYMKLIDKYDDRKDILEWKKQLNIAYFEKLNEFKIERFPVSDCIENSH